jgi:transcription termination/antitermination protein NusA
VEPRAIILDVGNNVEAVLATSEQSQVEHYRIGQNVKAYVLEVRRSSRGPQILVSRTHKGFLKRLFELEVPEVHNGTVEIKAIAREPGSRSKVAVASRQEGLDPVGATVGQRGARVQAVVAELGGEKIDIIPWNDDASVFVANALSPAQVIGVDIDEEHRIANVTVPERMLSLAIGREGQNARLAARLTGWRIDIRSDVSVAAKAAEEEAGGDAVSAAEEAVGDAPVEAAAAADAGSPAEVAAEAAEPVPAAAEAEPEADAVVEAPKKKATRTRKAPAPSTAATNGAKAEANDGATADANDGATAEVEPAAADADGPTPAKKTRARKAAAKEVAS